MPIMRYVVAEVADFQPNNDSKDFDDDYTEKKQARKSPRNKSQAKPAKMTA